jgi:hypothetical protein
LRFEEYWINRPLFDKNQGLKQEQEKIKQERDQYKLELEHERIWKRKEEEYKWSILEMDLDEVNKQIVSIRGNCGNGHTQLSSPQRLKEMVMDVYHYPSKHTELIRLMMERHDSERQEKRSVYEQ